LAERGMNDVRVGTVDKFQGQEAPVVIVSLADSADTRSSRGLEFLFDERRLNVAVSRAQLLTLVVGHPELAFRKAQSVKDLKLLNTYARLVLHHPAQQSTVKLRKTRVTRKGISEKVSVSSVTAGKPKVKRTETISEMLRRHSVGRNSR